MIYIRTEINEIKNILTGNNKGKDDFENDKEINKNFRILRNTIGREPSSPTL